MKIQNLSIVKGAIKEYDENTSIRNRSDIESISELIEISEGIRCDISQRFSDDSITDAENGLSYSGRVFESNSSRTGNEQEQGRYSRGNNNVKVFRSNEESQYQQRTSPLTDREVLEMASNEIKVDDLTPGEQQALEIFQNRLGELKDLQEKRSEQGKLYKQQQFGTNTNKSAAKETLNRMHVLDNQIKKASSDLLSVEEKKY